MSIFSIVPTFFIYLLLLFPFICSLKAEYVIPLPIEPQISGSFGEYRPGHFHQGLDFRTYTLNGIPIVASKEGSFYKILGSNINYGFGQALYLRHPNSTFTVYGHLNNFASLYSLEAAHRLYQIMAGDGYFTVELPPDRFPVRQGQVVAYSGEKGSGYSHLHFEIRDAKFNPMNPLGKGMLKLQDKDKPVIDHVYVTTHRRRIRGQNSSVQACKLRKRKKDKVYSCGRAIGVDGSVYIRLRGFDKFNARNRLGINRIKLMMGETVLYSVNFDKISSNIVKREQDYYDLSRTSLSPTNYTYNLYWRSRGNRKLPGYVKSHENFGWIDTKSWRRGEKRTIKIISSDHSNNETVAVVELKKTSSKTVKGRKARYNRERGSRVRESFAGVFVSSGKLTGPAYLQINRVKKRLPSFLRKKGNGYAIKWSSSKGQRLNVCMKTPSASYRPFYSSGRLVRRISYNKKKRCYEFAIYRSTTVFLAKDVSAPQVSLAFTTGPLESQYYPLVIKDSGTGFSLYRTKVYLDGILLNQDELRTWGVYYDRDRKSLLFPTGNVPQLSEVIPGRLHQLWVIAADRTGNRAKKWKGYINLRS